MNKTRLNLKISGNQEGVEFIKSQTKMKLAFTLLELIIVIVILIILSTIGFLNYSNYSSQARDAKRISDMENIKTVLDLYSIKTGKYIKVIGGETLSGTIGWKEKELGNWFLKDLALNKLPLDPKTKENYKIKFSNNGYWYKIDKQLESGETYSIGDYPKSCEEIFNKYGLSKEGFYTIFRDGKTAESLFCTLCKTEDSTCEVDCLEEGGPNNSNYIIVKNTINNVGGIWEKPAECDWTCTKVDEYKNGNTCSPVGVGYYSPSNDNLKYECNNKPNNSSYNSSGNGENKCSYICTGGYSGINCQIKPFSCGGWVYNKRCDSSREFGSGIYTSINGCITICVNSKVRCCERHKSGHCLYGLGGYHDSPYGDYSALCQ